MLVGIDQGISGAEAALHVLIAGRHVLRGKVIECKRLGECEALFGAVITLQCFGNGLFTGCDAIVPRCGSGPRGALPRDDSTDKTHARHSGKITHPMVQGEMHLLQ